MLRRLTTKRSGLDNENEDNDNYEGGVTLSNLVFVLVRLLVLDFGIFGIGSCRSGWNRAEWKR
jgi:hypothetical protein